jgi:hypothetical protein
MVNVYIILVSIINYIPVLSHIVCVCFLFSFLSLFLSLGRGHPQVGHEEPPG